MIDVLDPRFEPVAQGAGALERLASGAVWSEGPVWLPQTGELLWSGIPNNCMVCWHPAQGQRVRREPCDFTNDVHGFVYTSSEDSVQFHHPDGTRIGRIAVPEKVGNVVFGGALGNEVFICASTSLYRIVLTTRGATA